MLLDNLGYKTGQSWNRKHNSAICDGANDVVILQEADIGVGISCVEGMQVYAEQIFSILFHSHLEIYLSYICFQLIFLTNNSFQNSRQSCQVTLQLLSSVIRRVCFLCTGISVVEGSH